MTINDILRSIPIFQELMGMKMDFNLGYKLQKLTNEIDIVTTQYDKSRNEALKEFGILSEDKSKYEFEDGKREEYDEVMEAIHKQEVELNFTPIPVSLFEDIDIEPVKVRAIAWMLED